MSRFSLLDENNITNNNNDKELKQVKEQPKPTCTFERSFINKNGQERIKHCLDSDCCKENRHNYNSRVVYSNGRKRKEYINTCPLKEWCYKWHQKNERRMRLCKDRHPIKRMKSPCYKGYDCEDWKCGFNHSHPRETCTDGPSCYYADHPTDELLCRKRHGNKLKPLCKTY